MKIGFISDVHGHLEALEIALNVLRRRGIDDIYFLGDAVGYLPGSGVVPIVSEHCKICLQGNHEIMLIAPDTRSLARESIYQLLKTRNELGAATNIAIISSWPETALIEKETFRVLLVHGSPAEPLWGYVYPDTLADPLGIVRYTHIVCGHTHRPFQKSVGATLWLNCGSVGLPRDDGRYGSLGILDLQTGEAQILRFEITRATQRALQRVGSVAAEVTAVYARRGRIEGEVVA